jgi:triosephosphate isomerase
MGDARPVLVAANWKMNGLGAAGLALAADLAERARENAASRTAEILLCPPATLLERVSHVLAGSGVRLGGQDCHAGRSGAFTGDIAASMLVDAGCSHVILGHSERRQYHHETSAQVRAKAEAALEAGLVSLICVGETEAERNAGHADRVVERQIRESLPLGATPENAVIAYEPIWAIGTGRTPTIGDVAAMHHHIRDVAGDHVPHGAGLRILYGGSVKSGNALELLAIADVDGALVGGASLDATEFWKIVLAAPVR